MTNIERTRCEDVGQLTQALTDLSVVEDVVGSNASTNLLVRATLQVSSRLPYGSDASKYFIRRSAEDLASALGIETGQLKIFMTAEQEGASRRRAQSINNTIMVVVVDSSSSAAALRELVKQLNNLNSPLFRTSTAGTSLIPGQTPTFDFVCPEGMSVLQAIHSAPAAVPVDPG